MTLKWILLIVGGGGVCCVPPMVFDFQSTDVGSTPHGWTFAERPGDAAASWQVKADGDNHILQQSDRTRSSGRMALAITNGFHARNVRLSVRLRVLDGDKEQSGGIVWRYADPEHYMLARLDVLEKRVCLYRVFRGHRIMFGMVSDLPLERDNWYTLRVEHTDNQVKVYLDDEIQLLRFHRHVIGAGRAGLWVKGDSVVEFDDLRLHDRADNGDCCRRGPGTGGRTAPEMLAGPSVPPADVEN